MCSDDRVVDTQAHYNTPMRAQIVWPLWTEGWQYLTKFQKSFQAIYQTNMLPKCEKAYLYLYSLRHSLKWQKIGNNLNAHQ